jgi:hypothetical protein
MLDNIRTFWNACRHGMWTGYVGRPGPGEPWLWAEYTWYDGDHYGLRVGPFVVGVSY